ncbi:MULTISPECIES: hypothetical protein [unclassified Chryseobacterium]|uniref:hypothetical protein n=1 Tax=unclassified Chryseobacterium TaxID=2593645 RepID=UPI002269C446|nr:MULTISPECIES: hypothetical protein [unclassified Chryseobacterium]
MKKIKLVMLVAMTTISAYSYAQVGINTNNPQASLDVVGNPTNTSKLDGFIPPRLTGDQLRAKTYTAAQTGAQVYVTAADSNPSGQTASVKTPGSYYFDGTVWKHVVGADNALPNGTGTVIMINGVLQVAQEMSLRLSNDWTFTTSSANPSGTTNRFSIGNMTTELIDNYNGFTGTAASNSFTVQQAGTYLIGMNFPIQNPNAATLSGNLYYGVFNVTDNVWENFGLDTIQSLSQGQVENVSYLVALDLLPSKTYSFYIGQQQSTASTLTMRGISTINGNTALTYFSVKRLK